jgi:ketosteroid isomerase-like protein
VRLFGEHDKDALRAVWSEDFVLIDHRSMGWQETHGLEETLDLVVSAWQMAPDIRAAIDEVIAVDERTIALLIKYVGSGADGGGAIEIPIGYVSIVADGHGIHAEQFDPHDRDGILARYRELGGTRSAASEIDDPELAAFFERYAELYWARDLEGLLASRDPEFVSVDHRELGWEPIRGIAASERRTRSAFDAVPDLRFEIDKVVACEPGAVAMCVRWVGHSAETGGAVEVPVGYVFAFREGRVLRDEMFEPDAETSMLACFADLNGRRLIADTPVAHIQLPWIDCFGRHDVEGLRELIADEYTLVDHRSLGWDDQHGPDDFIAGAVSAWATWPDLRVAVDEVLACDEHTLATRVTYHGTGVDGGGAVEVRLGYVTTYSDRQITAVEIFEHDDAVGMLARYAELGGGQALLGDRIAESWLRRYIRAYAARDLKTIKRITPQDWSLLDHRSLGWGEMRGVEAHLELTTSSWDAWRAVTLEVDEVLACTDTAIAARVAYRGISAYGGGRSAIPLGLVLHANGLELFEPDDRDAILARFEQLSGAAASVRRAELGDTPVERIWAASNRSFNEHDYDLHLAQHAPDFVLRDHRHLGWGEIRGRDALADHFRAAMGSAADVRFDAEEVLASDGQHVVAKRGAWRSDGTGTTGPWEIPVAFVTVIENGLLQSHDLFEHDDIEGVLACYRRLSFGDAEAVVSIEVPPPRATQSDDAFNRRDLAAMAESYAEDIVLVDHRKVGWEVFEGREAVAEQAASLWRHMSPDIQVVPEEVLASDGRVFARRASYHGTAIDGGGQLDLALGQVGVMSGGQVARLEWFDPDDTNAMLARYAELGGGLSALGDRPPERFVAEFSRVWARGDLDAFLDLHAEDCLMIDHRKIGWEELRGRDALEQLYRSGTAVTRDLRHEVDEVVACDDRVIAIRDAWRGRMADGGGAADVLFGGVWVVEDGRIAAIDIYDYDDRAGLLARFAELSEATVPEPRRLKPWERFDLLYNARRLDELNALYSEEYRMVDRRAMGWEEIDGGAALIETCRSFLKLAPDLMSRCEVLAEAPGFCLLRNTFSGHGFATEGTETGPVELVFDEVSILRGDQFLLTELFDPGDEAVARARYEELVAGRAPERRDNSADSSARAAPERRAERVWRRYLRAYNDHDLEGASACLAANWALTDHRATGMWDEVQGRDAWAQQLQTVWKSRDGHDMRLDPADVLALDDGVGAWVVRFSGTDRRGGPYEVLMGWVITFAGEQISSLDMYEAEDRVAILARYAELGGGLGPLGDTVSERLFAEYAKRYAARDLDGLMSQVSEDWVLIDHRTVGWDELRRDQYAAQMRGVWDSVSVIWIEVGEVLAAEDRVLAVIYTYRGIAAAATGGGPFEYPVGYVGVNDGTQSISGEFFEPNDRDAILARFAELVEPND